MSFKVVSASLIKKVLFVFFDHSFKSAEEVQRYLDLETLASIRSIETS